MRTSKLVAALAAGCALFAASTAGAVNLLANPGFEAPPNAATSASFQFGGGTSAAPGWELYNNTTATTTSEVVDSTLFDGEEQMLHLTTGGLNNGVYQYFPGLAQYAQARVYVNSGSVLFYLFLDGNTQLASVSSSTTGQWETLNLNTGSANANEIVIYAGAGGANFFVDNVYAGVDPAPAIVRPPTAVPEPASWALMILGFGAAGAALRQRRRGLA